jgi:hypothetical protein
MQLVPTTNRRRDEMSKKLITTISLVFALATACGASTALADPLPDRAANGQGVAGVCNMLNVGGSAVEFAGMDNSSHGQGYDVMVFDLIIPACFS